MDSESQNNELRRTQTPEDDAAQGMQGSRAMWEMLQLHTHQVTRSVLKSFALWLPALGQHRQGERWHLLIYTGPQNWGQGSPRFPSAEGHGTADRRNGWPQRPDSAVMPRGFLRDSSPRTGCFRLSTEEEGSSPRSPLPRLLWGCGGGCKSE